MYDDDESLWGTAEPLNEIQVMEQAWITQENVAITALPVVIQMMRRELRGRLAHSENWEDR